MTWFDSITYSMNINLGKLWETVKSREACSAAVHGVAKSRIQLSNNNNNPVSGGSFLPLGQRNHSR